MCYCQNSTTTLRLATYATLLNNLTDEADSEDAQQEPAHKALENGEAARHTDHQPFAETQGREYVKAQRNAV